MASNLKIEPLKLLLAFIDQAYDKKAWHGPTLRGATRGVTASEAAWRPSPKHHNIRELVLHAAYWKYAVRRRLTGGARGAFLIKGSNWFDGSDNLSPAQWKQDLVLMDEQHMLLRKTIAELPPSKLGRLDMIYGIASHDLYHAGQVQLLKRLIRGGVVKAKL
jgi:hypothetical protein